MTTYITCNTECDFATIGMQYEYNGESIVDDNGDLYCVNPGNEWPIGWTSKHQSIMLDGNVISVHGVATYITDEEKKELANVLAK